jgi:hypothetical protein
MRVTGRRETVGLRYDLPLRRAVDPPLVRSGSGRLEGTGIPINLNF